MRPGRVVGCCVAILFAASATGQTIEKKLQQRFTRTVRPFLASHCLGCHGESKQEAKLNLATYSSLQSVATAHQVWEIVLKRLSSNEMPPKDAVRQPTVADRGAVIAWIKAVRRFEADRHAGDPGEVLARRLSNAEYNFSIRDLTGVDIRPTREFPVDPANEAGFDNSGESLVMSPALLRKYLGAAREVTQHMLLTPSGISFAPHPVVTNTDRDKYCVKRIVQFYQRQPTDLADYFFAAWMYRHRPTTGNPKAKLADIAAIVKVSPKYLETVWKALTSDREKVGPIARLQSMWSQLPRGTSADERTAARKQCGRMRDFVVRVRRQLQPTFPNLEVRGSHKGSQTFVLWKNRKYAAHRRLFNRNALKEELGLNPDQLPQSEIGIPADQPRRKQYEAAFARFCKTFPDAFYISERGRDYLDKPREQQEKGRLLSAGFHSMMGYFRDDRPLYDMILSRPQQRELDELWRELDFVTSAPMRQYTGFLWFERTDSRYMRDPVFDFARAENKAALSAKMIQRLSLVYLAKARKSGGGSQELQAIEDYFKEINDQIRHVESDRLRAEPKHLQAMLAFAARAYRRRLSTKQSEELLAFYRGLRKDEGLTHDEAIQDTMVWILMSPLFSYRLDLAGSGSGQLALTDYELASRLSYFLWSSTPDEELLARAAKGQLRRREVLVGQVKRMLGDPRVRGLATEFAGNWLDFRRFEEHNSVDRRRFPSFTDDLRRAMFEEPVRFFIDVAQRDASVLDFLYAEHTFVNAELARHYGMNELAPAKGDWRRVDKAGQFGRGGLLPMSVFLTKNAPGLRTSPVKRGYWVVRRLLGEHIPPPPPDVPELPNDETKLGELTLRQALAKHREHKSCAACHDRFDSIGLIFENYGPTGRLRLKDLAGRPVQTTAKFPDGRQGKGLAGLRDYLRRQRQDDYVDNLCRKLLSYALGRSLMLSDDALLREMREKLVAERYRFGSLVETIVGSPQFLNKRGKVVLLKE